MRSYHRYFWTFALVVLISGLHAPTTEGQAAPDTTQASEPGSARLWEGRLQYEYDRVSANRLDWRALELGVRRDVGDGTVAVTAIRQARFGRDDLGVRLDGWHDLWTNAWGHLRVGVGPGADVRPRRTVEGGIHQAVGGWEGAVTYAWRRYRTEDVHLVRPEVARYVGRWYLRAFAFVVPRRSEWAVSSGVAARRSLSPPRSYVEGRIGGGRGTVLVGPDAILQTVQTYFASLRFQRYVTTRVGITAGVRYGDDGLYRRTGGTVGLLVRW